MATRTTAVVLAILLITVACTDRRPKGEPVARQATSVDQSAIDVATVRYLDQDTQALRMAVVGGNMYLTGKPFGFSRWDIGSNPAEPYLGFAAQRDPQNFSPLPQFGNWAVDYYGGGALAVIGRYAYSSGSIGLSVIDISNATSAREVMRYPASTGTLLGLQADPNYVYKALVAVPGTNTLFGFREQDFYFQLSTASAPNASIVLRQAYAPEPVCCVQNATFFRGSIYLAMRTRLWISPVQQNGSLGGFTEDPTLQAVNVVANSNFLFVHHRPSGAIGSPYPAGIYIFDQALRSVGYVARNPLSMVLSEDGQYLYINEDNRSVKILRLQLFGAAPPFPF